MRAEAMELDLSGLPEELIFLLSLLGRTSPDQHLIRELGAVLDWDRFMKLAMHHRVYPLAYIKLKEAYAASVPPGVMESLHRQYQSNTVKMLHLSREMSRVYERLDEAGVRTLLLKGPALAFQLYGDLAHRTSKDLDILVSPDEVERAEDVLLQLGYELMDYRALGNWKKKSHHLSYEHKEHRTQVEVHWRLNPHFSKSYSFEKLWERKRAVALANQTFHCLGNEDQLHYLTDHGARHGWFRLRWLMDIERLLPQISGTRLRDVLKQHGGKHHVGQALILSSQLLSAEIPGELEELTRDAKARRLADQALFYVSRIVQLNPVPEKSVAWHYYRYLFSLMSTRQKIAYLLNKTLPSSRDALLLPLPEPLYFLYYPLRPLLWFWRRFRQQSV